MNIHRNWGTEEEDNYLQVCFYQYPTRKKSNKELEKTGFQVTELLLTKYPELRRASYLEVLFTEQPYSEESSDSFTSYKRLREDF